MPSRVATSPARDKVTERVADRLGERLRDADRQRRAERVADPPGVFDREPPLLTGDPDPDGPSALFEPGEILRCRAARDRLGGGEITDRAQEVVHAVRAARLPVRSQSRDLRLDLGDGVGIEQLAQLGSAEQLGEQRRVERQRLRAAFGQRRVALVQEHADVAEQQRPCERRSGRRLDLDQPHPPCRDVAHQTDQPGQVEDVLQAFPHRLEHDGEVAVFARHLQQLAGPLALLPQRRSPARVAAGQQQRPGRALAEPGCEQRRTADLGGDDLLDLLGLEQRDRSVRRCAVGVRQAQHDAVV
jgi:hypothetical protein